MVEYDNSGGDNASESGSRNEVNHYLPSGAPSHESADRFKLTYKRGNVVYEMVPMNTPTPEPPETSACAVDECSHTSTPPSECVVAKDDLVRRELSLHNSSDDSDQQELDQNSIQFDEQEALSATDVVFGDTIPEVQPDPSKVRMFGPLRHQQQEWLNNHRVASERSENLSSNSPPNNTSPDARHQTLLQQHEVGVEMRKGSLPDGKTARKPKKQREKSVKHSYCQKKEGLALKSVDDILADLGEISPLADGTPNANTLASSLPLNSAKKASKVKGPLANTRRKNMQGDSGEARRGSDEQEVEVPLELDPDITYAQSRVDDDTSVSSPAPRSSSPPSITTTTNSIATTTVLPTDDNGNTDEKGDAVVESVGITFLLLRNPFINFTRQQLRQMTDKEKKARWLYDSGASGGKELPLPSAEECEHEWKLLKRKWDDFLHKGEKPTYYRDVGPRPGAVKDKTQSQRQSNVIGTASTTIGGRRFNRGSANYAR